MTKNEQQASALPDLVYQRLFQQDRDGIAVLEELAARYYDGTIFVPGQPDQTAFNLGARSVILYIMQRAATNE